MMMSPWVHQNMIKGYLCCFSVRKFWTTRLLRTDYWDPVPTMKKLSGGRLVFFSTSWAWSSAWCSTKKTMGVRWEYLSQKKYPYFREKEKHENYQSFLREGWHLQKWWIFGKVPNGLWPPSSFSESYIVDFATKLRQKCICSYGGTFVYYMILFPMRCM